MIILSDDILIIGYTIFKLSLINVISIRRIFKNEPLMFKIKIIDDHYYVSIVYIKHKNIEHNTRRGVDDSIQNNNHDQTIKFKGQNCQKSYKSRYIYIDVN